MRRGKNGLKEKLDAEGIGSGCVFFFLFLILSISIFKNALEKYGQDRMADVEHSLQKKKDFDE